MKDCRIDRSKYDMTIIKANIKKNSCSDYKHNA